MDKKRICPVERAGALESSLRKLFQDPKKILSDYIDEYMTVLDLGCGPGFFSIEIARMLNYNGKVIAADLQQGMLDKLKNKIDRTDLENRIELHKSEESRIGVTEQVDFVLAFYMIHELCEQAKTFQELRSILKPYGKLFIVEPKFHVTKEMFDEMIHLLEKTGFEVFERPNIFFSRAVLLRNIK